MPSILSNTELNASKSDALSYIYNSKRIHDILSGHSVSTGKLLDALRSVVTLSRDGVTSFASQEKLAEVANMSRRTMCKCMKILKQEGILWLDNRYRKNSSNQSRQTTNCTFFRSYRQILLSKMAQGVRDIFSGKKSLSAITAQPMPITNTPSYIFDTSTGEIISPPTNREFQGKGLRE